MNGSFLVYDLVDNVQYRSTCNDSFVLDATEE